MKNIIKKLRADNNFMTQQELADKIGVNRVTITNIENGSNPSADVMIRIANFFGKDPRTIFFNNSGAKGQQKDKEAV